MIFEALQFCGYQIERRDAPFQVRCLVHKGGREEAPSARCYPDTDSIYCFACGKTYTPVSLLQAVLGMTRRAAEETLGIVSQPQSESPIRELERVLAISLDAIRYLAHGDAKLTIDWLNSIDDLLVKAAVGDISNQALQSQLSTYIKGLYLHPDRKLSD